MCVGIGAGMDEYGKISPPLGTKPRTVQPITILYNNYAIPATNTYVVWQKSNETDFLLTMNFIFFTNQGYTLQNSSLGQLHSDGGVVSIVSSSAGKLLLVYLSARRVTLFCVLSKIPK